MKRLTMMMLALALALPAVLTSTAGAKGPAVDIPRLRIDMGRVFQRERYEASFVVRNRGDAILVIEEVKPGCGCTAARFDSVIAPGAEGSIDLALDGSGIHGHFEKSATVRTNDPQQPQLTITIAGNIVRYIDVQPEETIYLHGRYDEAVKKDLTISSNEESAANFKVTGLTSDIDDKITYSFEPGQKKGEYLIHVSKNPKMPISSGYGSLVVHTNSPHSPETKLQVQVMTKGSFTVTPGMVTFGQVKFSDQKTKAPPVTRDVVVTSAKGPFKITGVTMGNPNFTTIVQPVGNGQQYRVQVTFTPPVKRLTGQNEASEMVIHTDDSLEPAVRVQVIARSI